MIKRAKICGKYSTNGGEDKGPSMQEFCGKACERWDRLEDPGVYGRTIQQLILKTQKGTEFHKFKECRQQW